MHRKAMPARQPLEMSGRYRFHSPLARRHGSGLVWRRPPVQERSELQAHNANISNVVEVHFGGALEGRTLKRKSGLGYGSRLANGVFEALRRDGKRVIAKCPFMSSYAARHPEYGAFHDG
jgi:GCN5-related N-acetyl-transferase